MLTLNFLFSSMFIILNHPLALGGLLLLQTILMALMSGFMFINFWFSYILFLIMVGGMMIMFMYMTSIASNEKFLMPNSPIWPFLLIFPFLMIIISMKLMDHSLLPKISNLMQSNSPKSLFMSLNKFFNWPNFCMLIMLMMYLLITLIAIVKITGKPMKPIRQN
uniref:NADH-ubiquinone oxidoreductase chain 6 n=1 Tax=Scolytinae sp. BMNH 1039996 TaxID=1903774 RepID=A0A343A512_9CUCU|nr:NADH dehydrogenase subunit 6 [Scolytinae sp. BMNH 1039996]